MTKIILLFLIVSLPSFAQTDELTLESTTSPTIIEDGTDFSQAPAEEPVEAPDSFDVTENYETVDAIETVPAELPDTAPTEMADSAPVEVTTPNPLAEEKRPNERPEEVVAAELIPADDISTPVMTTRAPQDNRFINHRASHWLTTFAFEGMKYELPFDFEGVEKNIRTRDQDLYGGRLGVGGQLHLGKGLITTSMVEGFYVGTLFTKSQEAGPDVDGEEAGSIKRTSGFFGLEVAQSLGYIFEFRTKNPFMDEWAYLTFEPFIEAGLGVARSYNKVNYQYDTGPTGTEEKYKRTIRDELTNARVGGGFNITGRSGFFMTARVTVNSFDITKRKIDTYRKQDDLAGAQEDPQTEKDVKIDPVTVFTLGGGYKF